LSKNERTSEYIYHYTTMAGFKGIVESREIWATDLRYMNDPTELKLGYDYLNRTVCESGNSGNTIERDPSIPIFACSFSKHEDVLSQWRAYAKGGGVAIGFPHNLLQNVATTCGYVLEDCIYYDPEDESTSIQLLSKGVKLRLAFRNSDSKTLDDSEIDQLIGLMSPWIVPVIKHKAYKEEDEIRLLPSCDSSSADEIKRELG